MTRKTTNPRASAKCQTEKRKTINGDDLLWAMETLEVRRGERAFAAGAPARNPNPNPQTPNPQSPNPKTTIKPKKQFKEYIAPLRVYLAKFRDAEAAQAQTNKTHHPKEGKEGKDKDKDGSG